MNWWDLSEEAQEILEEIEETGACPLNMPDDLLMLLDEFPGRRPPILGTQGGSHLIDDDPLGLWEDEAA